MFDPGYFFYFDDWDLSVRYRSAGFKIYFIAGAHLWHKVSISTQKGDKPERWWRVMGESSVRFYLRQIEPTFELYASPINFDPEAPLFPISSPPEYSGEIQARLGTYYTAGMPEDHDGLIYGRFRRVLQIF